jgi:hypothetical protein
MRNTLALPIPSSAAIASPVLPSALSRITSAALRRAVGARPLYLPSAFALAIPSRCRSEAERESLGQGRVRLLGRRVAFGLVEAIWAVFALARWRRRILT